MTTKIIVEGFKSIGERVEVEVRPLTILAGANSSGKSSLMQALLLLKQTLESQFDPGVLLLDGPNAKFASIDDVLHISDMPAESFSVGFENEAGTAWESCFSRAEISGDISLKYFRFRSLERGIHELRERMSEKQLIARGAVAINERNLGIIEPGLHVIKVIRERCVLSLISTSEGGDDTFQLALIRADTSPIRSLIHVPGLRGNPVRSYPLAASGPEFPGTFENYTASVVARWMKEDKSKLKLLGGQLAHLGLTWKVEAKKRDDVRVELRVGRLPQSLKGGTNDLVNIADVGLGVSQALPVLVALLEARPGQLVYIEQPEIHLHPKAQVAMAGIIADAAKRGVLVVIETHSSLLLLATQTLVAEGKLPPDLVKLHWFERDKKTGATQITSRDLDEAGRFGDWPEDFDDVSLKTQSDYLDAVSLAMRKK